MRVSKLVVAGAVFSSFLLTGCVGGAVQAIESVGATFMTVRAGYQGYNAMKMAKAIRKSEPVFENYDAVRVEVLLNPREVNEKEIAEAFRDNVEWMIEKDIEVIGIEGLEVCREECPEKTLVVQFKEGGYGENLAQKLLAGEKLRGKLYYIDKASGKVIKEEPLEVAGSYADLIREINLSVGFKMLKSIEKEGDGEKLQKAIERFNSFNPIKEEYRELLKKR